MMCNGHTCYLKRHNAKNGEFIVREKHDILTNVKVLKKRGCRKR